jgi:hypothetical protein
MAEQTKFRTEYEFPLAIKQVRHYLSTSTNPAERKVWRDLLNGPAYNKFKNGVKMDKRKRAEDDVPTPAPKKKK